MKKESKSAERKNGRWCSITALVLSLVGILYYPIGFIGLIFGIVSLSKRYDGRGMAWAAVIIPIVQVIFMIALVSNFIINMVRSNLEATENFSQIANPASVHCEENGGTLEIRTDAEGGQYGVCIKNGKECEEWAYFREECSL